MVTAILNGISVTATNYRIHARHVWITTLCIATFLIVFVQTPLSGAFIILTLLVFLPAYLIDQGNKKKGRKH